MTCCHCMFNFILYTFVDAVMGGYSLLLFFIRSVMHMKDLEWF